MNLWLKNLLISAAFLSFSVALEATPDEDIETFIAWGRTNPTYEKFANHIDSLVTLFNYSDELNEKTLQAINDRLLRISQISEIPKTGEIAFCIDAIKQQLALYEIEDNHYKGSPMVSEHSAGFNSLKNIRGTAQPKIPSLKAINVTHAMDYVSKNQAHTLETYKDVMNPTATPTERAQKLQMLKHHSRIVLGSDNIKRENIELLYANALSHLAKARHPEIAARTAALTPATIAAGGSGAGSAPGAGAPAAEPARAQRQVSATRRLAPLQSSTPTRVEDAPEAVAMPAAVVHPTVQKFIANNSLPERETLVLSNLLTSLEGTDAAEIHKKLTMALGLLKGGKGGILPPKVKDFIYSNIDLFRSKNPEIELNNRSGENSFEDFPKRTTPASTAPSPAAAPEAGAAALAPLPATRIRRPSVRLAPSTQAFNQEEAQGRIAAARPATQNAQIETLIAKLQQDPVRLPAAEAVALPALTRRPSVRLAPLPQAFDQEEINRQIAAATAASNAERQVADQEKKLLTKINDDAEKGLAALKSSPDDNAQIAISLYEEFKTAELHRKAEIQSELASMEYIPGTLTATPLKPHLKALVVKLNQVQIPVTRPATTHSGAGAGAGSATAAAGGSGAVASPTTFPAPAARPRRMSRAQATVAAATKTQEDIDKEQIDQALREAEAFNAARRESRRPRAVITTEPVPSSSGPNPFAAKAAAPQASTEESHAALTRLSTDWSNTEKASLTDTALTYYKAGETDKLEALSTEISNPADPIKQHLLNLTNDLRAKQRVAATAAGYTRAGVGTMRPSASSTGFGAAAGPGRAVHPSRAAFAAAGAGAGSGSGTGTGFGTGIADSDEDPDLTRALAASLASHTEGEAKRSMQALSDIARIEGIDSIVATEASGLYSGLLDAQRTGTAPKKQQAWFKQLQEQLNKVSIDNRMHIQNLLSDMSNKRPDLRLAATAQAGGGFGMHPSASSAGFGADATMHHSPSAPTFGTRAARQTGPARAVHHSPAGGSPLGATLNPTAAWGHTAETPNPDAAPRPRRTSRTGSPRPGARTAH